MGNELTRDGDVRMSVKEVADTLGVTPEAIKKHIRELYPEILVNGVPTYLKEEQVVAIKRQMIPTTKVVGATTDLEMKQKLMEVIQWLTSEMEKATLAKNEAETRVNRLIHIGRTYTTTELAKELNFKSAQELNQKLHEMGIQYKDHRGVWLLYSEYAAKDFQSIKQAERNGVIVYYASWTGIGRDWIMGLLASDKAVENNE